MLGIQAKLGGHDSAEVSRLTGVLEEVLPVGGAVLHLPDQTDELGMHAVDPEVDDRALPCLDDFFLYLLADLGDDFFDTCWVDAPILDELVKG